MKSQNSPDSSAPGRSGHPLVPGTRHAGLLATLRPLAVITAALLLAGPPAEAAQLPVVLDGLEGDWIGIDPAWVDAAGDGTGGLDLGRLWIADDDDYLYLRLEVGGELLLNGGNQLQILLDTDANLATGQPANGIGADLVWEPGQKQGTFIVGAQQTTVYHDNVGFAALPTVSATWFEAAFRRDARPNGSTLLFPATTIRIFIRDNVSGGDWLPNGGQTLSYTFDEGSLPAELPLTLRRSQSTDMRLLTWNILQDGLWSGSLQPKFRRVLQAAAPDIINFQEIYNHTAVQTRALIESWFPGVTYYSANAYDCHTLSRYPILGSWSIDSNLAIYLNTTAAIGRRTLLINVHLPCCENDQGRQEAVDEILAFIRDAKEPGGALSIPEGAAILITGDTNFVGDDQQLLSLLTGDIIDNAGWGADFTPDWDGGPLTDLHSRATDRRAAWTWRNDAGSFWPGRLDFWIYNDSAVEAGNHFVFDPSVMGADSLLAYGLEAADAVASDHLPHIADLRAAAPAETVDSDPAPDWLAWSITPNPSRGEAALVLRLPLAARIRGGIYDVEGRLLGDPLSGLFEAGPGTVSLSWHGTDFQGRPLAPGVYFLRIEGEDARGRFESSRRWVVLR